MSQFQIGAARQVALAPRATPASVKRFRIRDDAFSASLAGGTKQLKLGDPVDLGPDSTWYQKSWVGGREQTRWDDEKMFFDSTLDTTDTAGKITNWPGWKAAAAPPLTSGTRVTCLLSKPKNNGYNDVRLHFGTTVGDLWEYDEAAGTVTSIKLWALDYPNCLEYVTQDVAGVYQFTAIGMQSGAMDFLENNTGVFSTEATGGAGAILAMANLNWSLYYLQGTELRKRAVPAPGPAVHSLVKGISNVNFLNRMVTWNNKLWFCGQQQGRIAHIYSSDGTSVVEAFSLPDAWIEDICVHYGNLYILITEQSRVSGTGGDRSALYRYNGSTLVKVHGRQDKRFWATTNARSAGSKMCSWGKFLVLPWEGMAWTAGSTKSHGLLLYDAEQDAFSVGPTFDHPADIIIDEMVTWGGTVALAAYDNTGSGTQLSVVMHPRRDLGLTHIGFNQASLVGTPWASNHNKVIVRELISSSFDSNLPEAEKLWQNIKVKYKAPDSNAVVTVYAIIDGTNTITLGTLPVGTHKPSGGSGEEWRVGTLSVRDPSNTFASGSNIKSRSIQYKVTVSTGTGSTSLTTAVEIDSIVVTYSAVPSGRKVYRVRFWCVDGLLDLGGTALDGATAGADYLIGAIGGVYHMWLPRNSGNTYSTSDADHKIVQVVDYNEGSYPIHEEGTETAPRELSLTFVEVEGA